jgi:hypothetical protein
MATSPVEPPKGPGPTVASSSGAKASKGNRTSEPGVWRFFWREPLIIAMILSGSAIGAFALTDYDPQHASWIWVLLLPVFAAVAIWHTWKSARSGKKTDWPLIRRQIYHWLTLLITIKVLFVLVLKDIVTGSAGGMVALLLMALTCTLVGINFDWVFIPVGVILGCGVLIAALFRQYIWLMLVALAVAFAVLEIIRRFVRPKGGS